MEFVIKNKNINKKEYRGKTVEEALGNLIEDNQDVGGLGMEIIDENIVKDQINTYGHDDCFDIWLSALKDGAKEKECDISDMQGFVYGDISFVWNGKDIEDTVKELQYNGFEVRVEWTAEDVASAVEEQDFDWEYGGTYFGIGVFAKDIDSDESEIAKYMTKEEFLDALNIDYEAIEKEVREKETNSSNPLYLISEGDIEQEINDWIYNEIGDWTKIYNTEDYHQMCQDIADILNDKEDIIEIK